MKKYVCTMTTPNGTLEDCEYFDTLEDAIAFQKNNQQRLINGILCNINEPEELEFPQA